MKKALLAALVAVCVVAFFILDLERYLTLEYLKSQQAAIASYYRAQPGRTIALFFVFYVAATTLSLPGGALLTLAAGAIFGLATGTVLVSFASSLGALAAFLVARYLLHDVVQRRFGSRLRAVNAGVERDGAFYLFALRLVPAVPFFVVNLAMALTPIRPWTYYWVSQLGMLAGTIVYINAGTQLARIESAGDVFSPQLVGSFVLLAAFPFLARAAAASMRARKLLARHAKPRRFDRNLVVVGAGSAGLVCAYIAAAVKAKVTLVEGHRMGGDCLNTGCVPSKALIRTTRFMADIRRCRTLGVREAAMTFEFSDVMARVRRVVAAVAPHDSVERYTALGVECVQGEATIASPYRVDIATAQGVRSLTTRAIVIATGARPHIPPIPGIEAVDCLTSDSVWDLDQLPRRLLVLGAGPIGCELAQCFARLGSQVIQVEMQSRLLGREDPDVSTLIAEQFERDGIRVLTGHSAKRFVTENGTRVLVCAHGAQEVRIEFDRVLCAVGRAPYTEGLGLEALGIRLSRSGAVEVDEYARTRVPTIYACGDVTGPYQFTHTAAHTAWYATVNALFGAMRRFKVDYRVIPWCTFTEPEVARVGLNETDAAEKAIAHEVTVYRLEELDRAIADEAACGFVKVLTVPGKDRILGVTIVGQHAGEQIAEYVAAMRHGIGLDRILATIHVYPTFAEANKHAAGNWKKAHAPQRLLRAVERFHAWMRGMKRLSIIIPALDEEQHIGATLGALAAARDRGAEILVVDGGSRDQTVAIAGALADRVLCTAPGRATQLNAGAAAAAGDLLLFLHADSLPPSDFDVVLAAAVCGHGLAWGRFDVRIAGGRRSLCIVAALMNARSRLTGIATGDQGLFATRLLFERAGGFPLQPLMEDIAFCRAAKAIEPPLCLPQQVTTSGRRWARHGVVRTVLLMWRLRLAYFMGADPARLAGRYRDVR